MAQLPKLYTERQQLHGEIAQLYAQGEILQGVRLEFTPAGGTASEEAKQTSKYARLRAGKGKQLSNGKKSKYIPLRKIEHYQEAIARGKRLTKLQRRLATVETKIEQIEAIAADLGLKLLSNQSRP